MASQTLELWGQCTGCKDSFTVECVPVRRSSEKPGMKYYRPILNGRLRYSDHTLYHNHPHAQLPESAVHLFGSFRVARFQPYDK